MDTLLHDNLTFSAHLGHQGKLYDAAKEELIEQAFEVTFFHPTQDEDGNIVGKGKAKRRKLSDWWLLGKKDPKIKDAVAEAKYQVEIGPDGKYQVVTEEIEGYFRWVPRKTNG